MIASPGTGKNAPAIVAVRGSARLQEIMKAQSMRPKTGTNETAVFGDVFVTGDPVQVTAAKARRGRGSALSATMAKRVAEMSAKYDVWVISNVPGMSLAQDTNNTKSAGFGNLEALKAIEQFRAGLRLSSNFVLQIEAVTRDAAWAGSLGNSLQMLLAMAQQSAASKDPAAAEAFKRIEFNVQGRVLRVGMTVPAGEIQKQLEAARAQIPTRVPPRQAGPAATVPPANTDIVIYSSPKDMGTVVAPGPKK